MNDYIDFAVYAYSRIPNGAVAHIVRRRDRVAACGLNLPDTLLLTDAEPARTCAKCVHALAVVRARVQT